MQEYRILREDSSEVQQNYEYFLGVFLTLVASIVYSAGLVLQRYALCGPQISPGKVALFNSELTRSTAWGVGLVIYGSSNIFYISAMQFAPISLLTTVFGLTLLSNAVFSRMVMREGIDMHGLIGYVLIMVGISISAVGLPKASASYSADDIYHLATDPLACLFYIMVFVPVVFFTLFVAWFEQKYPLLPEQPWVEATPPSSPSQPRDKGPAEGPGPRRLTDQERVPGMTLLAAHFIYPTLLSTYETGAQLCLFGSSSMLMVSMEHTGQLNTSMFWIVVIVAVMCTLQVVVWLRKCYSRFATTTLLPIEYGTLIISSTLGGMMLFQEYKHVEEWGWTYIGLGEGLLVVGMGTVALAKQRQLAREVAPLNWPDMGMNVEEARSVQAGYLEGDPHSPHHQEQHDRVVPKSTPTPPSFYSMPAVPAVAITSASSATTPPHSPPTNFIDHITPPLRPQQLKLPPLSVAGSAANSQLLPVPPSSMQPNTQLGPPHRHQESTPHRPSRTRRWIEPGIKIHPQALLGSSFKSSTPRS